MTDAQQAKTLCGDDDQESFLVPSYGFESTSAGAAYVENPEYLREFRAFGRDDAFAPVTAGRGWYAPRAKVRSWDWSAGQLLADDQRSHGRPVWSVLRANSTPKPPTAYHTALLVEGPRTFYRYVHQTTKHPKWWYRIADGRRDCYAVWGRRENAVFGHGTRIGKCDVHAGRSGRGVLYAHTLAFDHAGKPKHYETRLVCIEFSMLDRDPARDDMLRVSVAAQQRSWSMDATQPEQPHVDRLDSVWGALIERARAGFLEHCRPVPEDVDVWRKMFIDQCAKADADRRAPLDHCFAERIRAADWQDALRMVEEPWHLQVVIERHAGSRFDETSNRYGANYNRVDRMLAQHDCTDERRAVLRKMVHDFVEPSDGLWNYTGD